MRFARAARLLAVLLCIGTAVLPACSRARGNPLPDPAVVQPPAPVPAPAPPAPRTGRLASEEILRGLVPGQTTRAEVRERFGTPHEVVVSPGIETFVYARDRRTGWLTRGVERVEMLTVRFDARGLLKDFEYRYTGE